MSEKAKKQSNLDWEKSLNQVFDPGIHFNIPFINNVSKFDTRVLTLDSRPDRFLTYEKKNVIVDSFVKWKVADVNLFYTTVSGGQYSLNQIMKDAMRSEFGLRTIKQLVTEDRSELRQVLMEKLLPIAKGFGIVLIDIRIKRIDLPFEVSNSVFNRMKAERERVAREFLSRGSEQAEFISAEADKQREILMATAYQKVEGIRGDTKVADIYANSFGKNKEFYFLNRRIKVYQTSFENTQDTLILEPKSDFFKYFSNEN